ncbi:MAG: D-alanyl-D-alanine carboxypeptidase family protein [Pseudomonadota bacterium]
MLRTFALATATALMMSTAQAAYETSARAAYLIDVKTGTVLFEKDAETALPPASMSKLMTLYMLFEALRDDRVTLQTEFSVSTKARQMGGSTMFLDETDRPTVEELIKGIIVQSGNDACVVVAEGLAGTEDAFARLMNERAPQLGMRDSTFANSTGWPDPNHRMSTQDLGTLAIRLIEDFPEYYGYFALEEWDFDGRSPSNRFNRNPLLSLGIGADGLKTGHTQEAGYGLVGSALQGNRRVVFVVTGLETNNARRAESEQIVNWAFRQFVEREIAKEGKEFARAPVWMGDQTEIGLVAAQDLTILIPAVDRDGVNARVEYRGPLEAPIKAGQHVANLVITAKDMQERSIALVSDRDVVRGGFVPRLRAATRVLFRMAVGEAQSLAE